MIGFVKSLSVSRRDKGMARAAARSGPSQGCWRTGAENFFFVGRGAVCEKKPFRLAQSTLATANATKLCQVCNLGPP